MGFWKKIRHWFIAVVVIIAVVICIAVVCYFCPPVAAALASAGSWLAEAGSALVSGLADLAVGAWSWGLAAWNACSFGTFYSVTIGTTVLNFNVGNTLLLAAMVTTVAAMGGWVSLGNSGSQSATPSAMQPILYEPSYGESSARAMLGADSAKAVEPPSESDVVVERRNRSQDSGVVAAAIGSALLVLWGTST